MRVRAKVTLLLALLFTVLIAAQWVIQQRLVLPRFMELERASARTDMQRVELAVERELQSLGAAASDWGNWADTWRYMRHRDPRYAQANLTDTAVRTLKVDYLALIASDGRFEWARSIDPVSGRRMEISLNRSGQLEPAWTRALAAGEPISGLIDTNAGAMLAAGAPILDGFNHGPARGMVIVGRLFNQAEQQRIGNQAQVALYMRPVQGAAAAMASQQPGAPAPAIKLTETRDTINVERVLANLSGRPLLNLGINVPRTISGQGANAVRYSTLSVSVAAAVVLAALIFMIGRIVLGPLGKVTDHAERIAAADDLSARLDSRRQDELGTLAASIDHMVERLAQSRRELIDRSFESGVAENASGVLHNLGNAMTPLGVHAAALAQQLGAMPIGDVQQALAELLAGTADEQRQQDLRQYLQLLAAELARTHGRAADSLHRLLEQTNAVQAVLAAQRLQPRADAVRQSITPAELADARPGTADVDGARAPRCGTIGRSCRPGRHVAAVHDAGHGAAEAGAICDGIGDARRPGTHAPARIGRAREPRRRGYAGHQCRGGRWRHRSAAAVRIVWQGPADRLDGRPCRLRTALVRQHAACAGRRHLGPQRGPGVRHTLPDPPAAGRRRR